MPQLNLPWGESLHVEDLEQFSLDVMHLTAEYYVDLPTCNLIVVHSRDFITEGDNITVRSCNVRFIEAWPDEDDPDIEQKWQDFILVEETELPRGETE